MSSISEKLRYHLLSRWIYSPWNCPARDYENKHSISGISGDYKVPEGKNLAQLALNYIEASARGIYANPLKSVVLKYTARNLVTLFQKACHGQIALGDWQEDLRRDLKEIIALNPDLEKINYDSKDTRQVLDFFLGVASGFNLDDIEYYLNRSEAEVQADRVRLENSDWAWIPSCSTRDKISQALAGKLSKDLS